MCVQAGKREFFFFFISKNTNILDINSSTGGTVQNTHQHQGRENFVS